MVFPGQRMPYGVALDLVTVGVRVPVERHSRRVQDGRRQVFRRNIDIEPVSFKVQGNGPNSSRLFTRIQGDKSIKPPLGKPDSDTFFRHKTAVSCGNGGIVSPYLVACGDHTVGHAEYTACVIGIGPVGDNGGAVFTPFPGTAIPTVNELYVYGTVIIGLIIGLDNGGGL